MISPFWIYYQAIHKTHIVFTISASALQSCTSFLNAFRLVSVTNTCCLSILCCLSVSWTGTGPLSTGKSLTFGHFLQYLSVLAQLLYCREGNCNLYLIKDTKLVEYAIPYLMATLVSAYMPWRPVIQEFYLGLFPGSLTPSACYTNPCRPPLDKKSKNIPTVATEAFPNQ